MSFTEWKQRSSAYRNAIAAASDEAAKKKIESLCRAAFVAGFNRADATRDIRFVGVKEMK